MRINAKTEKFEKVTVFGKPMLFTSLRVDKGTVPDGLYIYEVRHDDEGQGDPIEVANFVMVNHWGTLISAYPIKLTPSSMVRNAYKDIDPEKDWSYEGMVYTLEEYLKEIQKDSIASLGFSSRAYNRLW